MPLSTDIEVGDSGHADLHNEERTAINAAAAAAAGSSQPGHGHASTDVSDFADAADARIAAAAGVSVASLSGGKIPSDQLPPLAIGEVFTVASQAAMLALPAQRGDVALRTDLDPDGWFILTTDSPGTLVDWVQITAVGSVTSVAGRTGAITLAIADVAALQAALDAKAPLASPAFTGTPTGITKTHVGLGSVDNTADTAKPVSTAQQTALDGKISKVGGGLETVQDHGNAGSTETLDLGNGNYHRIVLDANCTLTLSGATNGAACSMTVEIVQDATGSRTLTWPASVKWPGGTAGVHSATANAVSLVVLVTRDGGTTWRANLAGAAYS